MVVNQKVVGSNSVCRAKHFHFEVRVLSVDALAARTRPKWPNSADKRSLGERTGRTRTSPTRLRSAVPGSHSHTLRRGMFVWLTADFLPASPASVPPTSFPNDLHTWTTRSLSVS